MTITQMAMMAWMAGTVAHAGQRGQTLTVYLRDRANIPSAIRIRAKALTTRMFAEIGVSLEWCTREPVQGSSQLPVIVELVTETPESRQRGALAFAQPYEGTHITVFFDRIEKTQSPSTVLAHVIVHEITHIVQGINRHHSESGIMKAYFEYLEYQEGYLPSPRPLMFTSRGIAGPTCRP